MTLEIVPLEDRHLEDAAALFAARYRAFRGRIPEAPERFGQPAETLPMLQNLLARGQGFAALHGGKLAGFLAAWLTPRHRGQRTVYSPEWAHAAEEGESAAVYRQLYAVASAAWVANRYCDHYLTLLTDDPEGIEAWRWMGFGTVVMDGVRDLRPVERGAAPQTVEIRRAGPEDLPDGLALMLGLNAHLAAAPIFLTDAAEARPEEFDEWFANPANAMWIAYRGGRPVASIGIGPANEDACTVIRDEGTASFMSAYTLPKARGSGLASALLDCAIRWARERGYVRCAVDFETANTQASRFWPRHFKLICHSLGRRVNPYILEVTSRSTGVAPVP